MPRHHLLALCAAAVLPVLLSACNSSGASRTEELDDRLERQDKRIDSRDTRRRMRAEAEDRRYNDWYNRIMGRPSAY